MTKIAKSLTGKLSRGNTSANLSRPLPLLVVHSGKMTTGLSAFLRSSSNELNCTLSVLDGAIHPVVWSMAISETWRYPRMLERGVGVRVEGDEIAAEPVPVRRPGVCVTGVDAREESV